MSIADAKAAMARAYAGGDVPQLDSVSPDGMNEIWTLGHVLFLLPVVPPNAPPELEYALRLRRDASLSGQCDECGAACAVLPTENPQTENISAGLFSRRGNCLAADGNIYPLLSAYYQKRDNTSLDDRLAASSRQTEAKLLASLPDRIDIPATSSINERFVKLLDEKIATAKKHCPHLDSDPVQTWHVFLWDDTWRCDECSFRFAAAHRSGPPLLSPLEESTCDYCRRYSPTFLHQTVSRVGTFVLYGAACRRCAREFETGDDSLEAKT